MEKDAKKAFELAQEEVQEKEIANLKNIIKDLLQKKANIVTGKQIGRAHV